MSLRLCLLVVAVVVTGPASAGKAGGPPSAEEGYQAARKSYYALKQDAAGRKFRHNWLQVAVRFAQVAERHPKSARAPDAHFTAAELYNELSRISRLDEDLQRAIAQYTQLLDRHPRHRLADDAALALGQIHLDRLNRPAEARRVLQRALKHTPTGDVLPRVRALLASIAPATEPAASKVVAKVAAAASEKALAKDGDPVSVRTEPQGAVAFEQAGAPAEQGASGQGRRSLLDAIASVAAPLPSTVLPAAEAGLESPAAPSASGELAGPEPGSPATPAEGREPVALSDVAPTNSSPLHEEAAPPDGAHALASEEGLAALPDSEPGPRMAVSPSGERAASRSRRIRRIVIDPGHGGHDSGALGRKGTREKDVALSISKRLADHLRADGYEVILTRDGDRFIRLEDRARIANEARGDLFLSIHCNSARSRKLRGIETYTLNVTSDRYALRLSARENAATEAGMNDLQFILADLDTKANTEESARLANEVQDSLVSHLRRKYSGVKDLGTKEALFYVLLGARMPAILVETSFLSHPEEEARLVSGAYQKEVARAIATGIQEFVQGRGKVARID